MNKQTFINCYHNNRISLKPIDKYLIKTIERQSTSSINNNDNNNEKVPEISDLSVSKSEISAELSAAVVIIAIVVNQ